MMFFARKASVFARCSVGLSVASLSVISRSQCQSESQQPSSLCVYLSLESRGTLAAHLHKLGVKKSVDYEVDKSHALGRDVVVKARLDDVDSYVYSPLYGERAAFRLKGIITTKEGEIVGIGRVTNLTGELFDEEYEASVLLHTLEPASAAADARRAFLHDLPTRLYQTRPLQDVQGTQPWKGSIPAGEVLGSKYTSTKDVSVRLFSAAEQLVVDGRICCSDYADAEAGTCSYDRADVPSQKPPAGLEDRRLTTDSHANGDDLTRRRDNQRQVEDGDSAAEEDAQETCPVCKYMKGGPCRNEFISWDDCIQSLKDGEDVKACYEVTAQMMACMQGHEYYDPMTANQQRVPAA